jgi:hypothetical protein
MRFGRFTTTRFNRILAAPFIPLHPQQDADQAGPMRQTRESLLFVQVCGLEPLCRPLIQMKTIRISRNDAGHRHRQAPEGGHQSDRIQQGMGSPDGIRLIERCEDQRLRWSDPVWSPPPESNRRPHPYHGTTRNRCANRRFPRSRPTVRAKVIGSLQTKLCVQFQTLAMAHCRPF